MGKKTIDFKTQRGVSRGRKSKAGGGEIKNDSIIYTPGLYARVEQFDNECNFGLIVSDQFLFDKIDSSLKSNCD